MRICTILILVLSIFGFARAETPVAFKVTYLSAEHVYLDAGKADGLRVGDQLAQAAVSNQTAVLEVVFVARHSASCRILDKSISVSPGAKVILITHQPDRVDIDSLTPDNQHVTVAERPPQVSSLNQSVVSVPNVPVRLYGSVSTVFYSWQDRSPANVDFSQTSGRLNLRAVNIGFEHLEFAVRSRGRYDVRSRAYGIEAPEYGWENRIWVLSLSYDDPDHRIGFSAGRFLPRRLGSTGYLDGALVNARLTDNFEVGVFAGRRPKWAYHESAMTLNKYGGYFSYKPKVGGQFLVDQSLGLVADYHGSTVSRSFFAWTGSLRIGTRWGISQSVELEINRGWRADKANETFTLSNLFINSWLSVMKELRFSMQYDNRQNFWTYEYKSRADSLFDNRVRRGLRGRVDLSPVSRLWLSGSVGYRKADGDEDASMSYTGTARKSGIFVRGLSLGLTLSGFDGEFERGTNYSVRTQYFSQKLGQYYASFGGYRYSVVSQDDTRKSNRFELGTTYDFKAGYYIGGSTEWSTGDDIDGQRFQIEFGYRY